MGNDLSRQIIRVGRAVKRRLPVSVQRRLPGLSADNTVSRNPDLSVVIPVYNCEEFVGRTLDSVLASSLGNLEIIAVDDGSTDRSLEILRSYEAREPRLRVFSQANGGQGAARNVGVAHATGTYLTFVDADDTVPPNAYRRMIRTLKASGSDFVVGKVRRVQNGHPAIPPLQAQVHREDRIATTIDDFPEAMLDVLACNRVMRREFWVDKVGGFKGGIAYEDHVPGVVSYLRATTFDVLRAVTYEWHVREGSTSNQKHKLQNLLDRIAVKEEAEAIMRAEASPQVFDAWVARVLDADLSLFVEFAGSADPEYREALQKALKHFLELASTAALDNVRLFQKAKASVAAAGAWDKAEALIQWFRDWSIIPPTTIVDGKIISAEDFASVLGKPIDAKLRTLSPADSRHRAELSTVTWVSPSRLKISGWSHPRSVDLSTRTVLHEVELRHAGSGATIDLEAHPEHLLIARTQGGDLNADYANAGFSVEVDTDQLAAHPGDWYLHITTTVEGVTRSGKILQAAFAGSARSGLCGQATADRWVAPRFDSELGFTIRVVNQPPQVTKLSQEPRYLAAQVASGTELTAASLHHAEESNAAALKLTQLSEGQWEIRVPYSLLNERPGGRGDSHFIRVQRAGDDSPLVWTPEVVLGDQSAGPHEWFADPAARAAIRATMPRVQVSALDVVDDQLQVSFTAHGVTPEQLGQLRLASPRISAPGQISVATDGTGTATFALRAAAFGGPEMPLPTGVYELLFPTDTGTAAAGADVSFGAVMPWTQVFGGCRVRGVRTIDGEFKAYLGAPMSDDEIGSYSQRQLQSRYQATTFEPEHAVFFQCYRGEFATDSQKALAVYLREHRPDLTQYWGVQDRSVVLPEGGIGLILNSTEWYEKLGRARYLCNNIDFLGWFRKGPHQRFLSTFHGYPFKSMGRGFWADRGYPAARIAHEIARRQNEWDTILVPSQMAVDLYASEYDWHGETLVLGYPRSDALVNATAEQALEYRSRLGIDPDATVVLYAPTYRDALTTQTYRAKRFDELDLDELTARLGSNAVVLLRGHNNNQREADRVQDVARVIDVTDYPDINDLTIAADVAILDYSSLRFDWALTGKPMVFFVPDVDSYFDGREPLFSFDDSTPGPLLDTTAQVADWLSDLPRLRTEYAGAIEEFNATYNSLQDGHSTENVAKAFFTD